MSDNDTQGFGGLDEREYDALAELFLGESDLNPARPAPAEADARPDAAEADTSAENAADKPAMASPLDPAPHAAIRQADRPSTAARNTPASLELVVLGHLPVRAGLWLKSYAASLLDEDQAPVALLRLAPDIASVDLLGRPGHTEPAPTFLDAIRRARLDAGRFVLRVNETAEPALAEHDAVDRVTVLTGADEAALVASYRLVKSLSAAWDRRFDVDEGPKLRMAIMGSEPEAALAAADKLRSAADSFLQRRIEIVACAAKIGAASGATLFRGETDEELTGLIDLLSGNDAGPNSSRTAPESQSKRPSATHLRLVEPPREEPWPIGKASQPELDQAALDASDINSDEPFLPEIVVKAQSPKPQPTHATSTIGHTVAGPSRNSTTPSDATSAGNKTAARSLGSRLDGLQTLPTVCPFAAGVEFAADREGMLHLLAETSPGSEQAEVLERLMTAAAWSRAHLELLLRLEPALAHPSPVREADHGPVLHLLTSDAVEARALLDTDLRVHLTRSVQIAGETAWVTDDLN